MFELVTGFDMLQMAYDENGNIAYESMLEDAVKCAFTTKVNCNLFKFYHTDGFGPYYGKDNVMFVLNESKTITAEDVFNQALTQAIIYYIRIRSGEYNRFSQLIVNLAYAHDYLDVQQYVIDHFGCFILTCCNKIMYVPVSQIKDLINKVEGIIKTSPKNIPSEYYKKNSKIHKLLKDVDLKEFRCDILTSDYNLEGVKDIFNNIMDGINV